MHTHTVLRVCIYEERRRSKQKKNKESMEPLNGNSREPRRSKKFIDV